MSRPEMAQDIMARQLLTLPPESDVFDAIELLLKSNITGAPVVDAEQNYLGVFSEKCCMQVLTLIARLAQQREGEKLHTPRAGEFMVRKLITLSPYDDVIEAIGRLLQNRISGAPVVEGDELLGSFSEKTSMQVLIDSAYDGLPSGKVGAFMNTDRGRVVSEDIDLVSVAQIFLDTPYRRLPVLRDDKLVGQISRRDVLRGKNHLTSVLKDRRELLLEHSGEINRSDAEPEPIHEPVPSTEVRHFMDARARTIAEELDLLSVAQIFLTTPYRRLPVLRDGKLVGQISRRDVLAATHELMAIQPQKEKSLLYLSALVERDEAPI